MEAKWSKEEVVWEQPDPEKIECTDCVFRAGDQKAGDVVFQGGTYGMCEVYEYKPYEILHEGAPCPYYVSENEE